LSRTKSRVWRVRRRRQETILHASLYHQPSRDTSYLILKQAAPEVKPHILYALAYGGNRDTMGQVAGIDYGPVSGIFGQYAYWPGICDGGSEYPVTFWRRLLSDKERADEDILRGLEGTREYVGFR